MELYSVDKHSHEEGRVATPVKSAVIYADRGELLKVCEYFERVKKHLDEDNGTCHMHLRDNFEGWNEGMFDIEMNLITKK